MHFYDVDGIDNLIYFLSLCDKEYGMFKVSLK